MKRTAIVAAASLMICVAPVIRASQDPAPPVTPETINGLWEALSKDDTRVFRLELDAGRGWLAVGIPFIDPMTFALTDTRWQKGGVELYFRGVGRSSRGAGGPDDRTPYTAVYGCGESLGRFLRSVRKVAFSLACSFCRPTGRIQVAGNSASRINRDSIPRYYFKAVRAGQGSQ